MKNLKTYFVEKNLLEKTDKIIKVEGSFRDPAGSVYKLKNKIFREIKNRYTPDYNFIKQKKIYEKYIKKNYLLKFEELEKSNFITNNFKDDSLILESQFLDNITYPYEWGFDQLKDAAIFTLNFNLELLNDGFTLKDASPYNVQFLNSKCIFIDTLSIVKYKEGDYWIPYRQFCEGFMNPLILQAKKNLFFNDFYRGNLNGINTNDLKELLSFINFFSPSIFFHVFLQNYLNQRSFDKEYKKIKTKFNKNSYITLIQNCKNLISKLYYKKKTFWTEYHAIKPYSNQANNSKKKIVAEYISKNKPNKVVDLGCNNGEYSFISLENGASQVLGYEIDQNLVNESYKYAKGKNLNFIPIVFDALNPSTNSGWNENERQGFSKRAKADITLSLAFIHHICIANNVPLDYFLDFMINISPKGLLEFVPKEDPMVQKMIKFKGDIFPEYNLKNLINLISQKGGRVLRSHNIDNSNRSLIEYDFS